MDVAELVRVFDDLEIESERLVLRRFGAADLDAALAQELDRRIMCFVRDPLPPDEARAKVESLLDAWHGADGEWVGIAVVLRATGQLIGMLALRVTTADNETVELGYRFALDAQRQGYAFEACRNLIDVLFDVTGVRKILACCVAANTRSFGLMEKLGMRREGVLRAHSRLGGDWPDELVYGMFAEERTWRDRPRPSSRARP